MAPHPAENGRSPLTVSHEVLRGEFEGSSRVPPAAGNWEPRSADVVTSAMISGRRAIVDDRGSLARSLAERFEVSSSRTGCQLAHTAVSRGVIDRATPTFGVVRHSREISRAPETLACERKSFAESGTSTSVLPAHGNTTSVRSDEGQLT